MKIILNLFLCIITMSIYIFHAPVLANSNLSEEEALSLIEETNEMYIDNDYYHDTLPQNQSDEYWKSRIPSIQHTQ